MEKGLLEIENLTGKWMYQRWNGDNVSTVQQTEAKESMRMVF